MTQEIINFVYEEILGAVLENKKYVTLEYIPDLTKSLRSGGFRVLEYKNLLIVDLRRREI